MSDQPTVLSANATSLEKAMKVLAAWDRKDQPLEELRDEEARESFDAFQADNGILDDAIAAAGLEDIAKEGRFFDFLGKSSHRMSLGEGCNALLGLIWAGVYNKASEATKDLLLTGLLTARDFFTPLYALPEFIRQADIAALSLAPWLVQVRGRLGNDGASGGFWGGIRALADHHPQRALEVLKLWTELRPSGDLPPMAVTLLGRMRSMHPGLTDAIDEYLSHHSDDQLRVIYHRSWAVFDQQTPIQAGDYQTLVEGMSSGTPDEMSEAFHLVRCTLPAPLRCEDSFRFGIRWLHANASKQPDGIWAYWIITLAEAVDARAQALNLPLCRALIPQLIPIPDNHDGAWRALDVLLAKLLTDDQQAFEGLLFEIARHDRNGLARRFSRHGGFHRLPPLMRHHSPEVIVAHALNSLDEPVRHLGLVLFDSLNLSSFSSEALDEWPDNWMAVLICQIKREPIFDSAGFRLLKAFIDRVERGDDMLKTFFVGELVWQMKNLPGACLKSAKAEIQKLPKNSLLHQAVNEAEQYFDKLTVCYRSAINSMEVAGYRRAKRIEHRKRSRQVSKSAEESSPLLSMMSKSYTLYGGKQWQTFIGGTLGQPTQMQEFKHEIEFPRMYALDPDGNAQRSREALHIMAGLVRSEMERRKPKDDS